MQSRRILLNIEFSDRIIIGRLCKGNRINDVEDYYGTGETEGYHKGEKHMKKGLRFVIAILIGIAVNAAAIGAVILWCKQLDKQAQETGNNLTPTVVVGTPTPGVETDEESQPLSPTAAIETTEVPTETPEIAKEPEITQALVVPVPDVTATPEATDVPVAEPTEVPTVTDTPITDAPTVPEPTKAPTTVPSATPTPTKVPTPSPTVTPTPAPQRKYTHEVKMGDNVWYRLAENRVLYVMGTGATWGYDMYVDEGGYYRGDTSGMSKLMKIDGVQHIVIEEGITKLGAWSLMWFPDVQSITFPKSLQEIEDYCFDGTGRTVNTVWIGLDKDKVKLGKYAFYGTVYQTEEDLRKPTPIPTSAPTPTSLPMQANSFYKALVEEAGIKIDKSETEPYSAALVREGILEQREVSAAGNKLGNQEVALILYKTAKHLGISGDETVIANAKKYERISDKRGIVPGYEEAVYFCFGTGIMPGKSDGEYSHTRSFEPKIQVREADGMLYCKRLFDESMRVPMSPDAQVLRTTNLPIQAKLYPYILESFPNEYYDMNYLYMYNVETDDRAYPDLMESSSFLETWCTPNTVEEFSKSQPERCRIFTSEWDYLGCEEVGMDKVVERYRDTWEQQAREYLELVFNFDYRTVREDTEWQEKIKNLNAFYHEWGKGVYEGSCAGIKRIDEWFAGFLDNAEKYHTVVECDEIDFDMSTLFYSERFDDSAPYTMRVHLRYKITTDAEPGLYEMAEIVPVRAYGVDCQFKSFGEWKDVYAELTFATNSFDRTGIGGVRILEYNVNDAIRYHFDPKQYVK